MKQRSGPIRNWLIQGVIGTALVVAWLLVRDPTSVVAYPLTCAAPSPERGTCGQWQTLDREYFRIDPARALVTTWEDRPMARAERLTDCHFDDLANWSCVTSLPDVHVGLREGDAFREIDGSPDPTRHYVGFVNWWWTWLGEVVTRDSGSS